MRLDLYTKIILTVIAVCLFTLSVRSLQEPPKVLAQTPSRVIIAGIDTQLPQLQRGVPVYLYASNPQQNVPVNLVQMAAPSLPVKLTGAAENALVPVRLTGAGGDGKSAVPVNVVQVAGNTIQGAGVPVVNQK